MLHASSAAMCGEVLVVRLPQEEWVLMLVGRPPQEGRVLLRGVPQGVTQVLV